MKKLARFPWYDGQWLRRFYRAQSIIEDKYPEKLDAFLEAMDVFRTRQDFEIIEKKIHVSYSFEAMSCRAANEFIYKGDRSIVLNKFMNKGRLFIKGNSRSLKNKSPTVKMY